MIVSGLKLFTQLNNGRPTAEYDCGVETTRGLIFFASGGKVDVDEPTLRRLMGRSGPLAEIRLWGPTIPRNWKTAIESDEVAQRFARVGLRPPRARLLDGVDVAIAEDELHKGKMLGAAVYYGTLNVLRPGLSGSRSFGDNHAVRFFRLEGSDQGHRISDLYDPLRDGRKRSIGQQVVRYPKGRVALPWWVAKNLFADVHIRTRDANGRITSEHRLGDGLFLGVSVAQAKPIVVKPDPQPEPEPQPEPQPEPTPAETPEQAVTRLTGELVVANEALDSAHLTIQAQSEANAVIDEQRQSAIAQLEARRDAIAQQRDELDAEEADLVAAITAAGGTPA